MAGAEMTGPDTDPTANTKVPPEAAERLRRLATWASLCVASTLIVAKLAAYLLTDSVALLSSLIDSSTDLLASIVAFVGVRHALRPADTAHRFGHGKAEALAALAQAAFITGSAALLAIEASRRMLKPEPLESGTIAIGVMLLSIALTGALITFQRYVVARTRSLSVGADRLHYSGDLLMNSAVIAAILITDLTGSAIIDPLFGLAIAGFLVFGAWRIMTEAMDMLMDRELPQAERERITGLVLAHAEVAAIHDLRTRRSGVTDFIELHMEVDPDLTVRAAHAIADEVESEIAAAYPGAEVIIHQEPTGLDDIRLDARITG